MLAALIGPSQRGIERANRAEVLDLSMRIGVRAAPRAVFWTLGREGRRAGRELAEPLARDHGHRRLQVVGGYEAAHRESHDEVAAREQPGRDAVALAADREERRAREVGIPSSTANDVGTEPLR